MMDPIEVFIRICLIAFAMFAIVAAVGAGFAAAVHFLKLVGVGNV